MDEGAAAAAKGPAEFLSGERYRLKAPLWRDRPVSPTPPLPHLSCPDRARDEIAAMNLEQILFDYMDVAEAELPCRHSPTPERDSHDGKLTERAMRFPAAARFAIQALT
jgi:hypothetical protein